jgi:hypothetical protein
MLYLENTQRKYPEKIPRENTQRKSWTLRVLNASIQSHEDLGGFDKAVESTPLRADR